MTQIPPPPSRRLRAPRPPRPPRPIRYRVVRALLILALVLALGAGGLFLLAYKLGIYQPPRESAIDRHRLTQVLTDPLLTDPEVERVAPWTHSAITRRATITTHGPWRTVPDEGYEHTLAERSLQTLADLRADGWQTIAAECIPGRSYVLAVKDFDGFTAALRGVIDQGVWLHVYVPYHDEPTNPWTPTTVFPTGSTCADRDDPGFRTAPLDELPHDDSTRLAAEAMGDSNIDEQHDALAPPTPAPTPAPTYSPPDP
ncbi:hypothetical protein AGMMS50218_04730 [Actinomycetota bacterium]|nr:hypothetical protein AGMMS50218_04730 [Actinomycetota bacterium]